MSIKWICVPESYMNKQNEEKTSWNRIGKLIVGKNGKEYVKLFTMPNILCSVFEDKPKEEKQKEESIDLDKEQNGQEEIPF